jgi:hypothetical protein
LSLTIRRLAPLVLTAACLAVSLGGCSWFHHKGKDDSAKAGPPPTPSCPLVAIVPSLAQASQFDGAATGYSNVTYTASLSALDSHCELHKQGVAVDATLKLTLQQGPKGKGGTFDFPYFVAILDSSGAVLAKSIFSSPLSPNERQPRIGSKEAIHEFIPLSDPMASGSYSVVIGFQLDDRQTAFNRSAGVGE